MKVTCIKEYDLLDYESSEELLYTFNVGDKFEKVKPNTNRKGYIRINVKDLKIKSRESTKNKLGGLFTYSVILVPKSHFLTTKKLRDYNINKILK